MKRFAYILVCATLISLSLPLNAMFSKNPNYGQQAIGAGAALAGIYVAFVQESSLPVHKRSIATDAVGGVAKLIVGSALIVGGYIVAKGKEEEIIKTAKQFLEKLATK
jgi:drug/metabolite transporter (DMT)-like permease